MQKNSATKPNDIILHKTIKSNISFRITKSNNIPSINTLSRDKVEKKKKARKRVRKPGSVRDMKEKKAEANLLKKGKTKEGTKLINSFFMSRQSQPSAKFQAPASALIQAQPSAEIQAEVDDPRAKKVPRKTEDLKGQSPNPVYAQEALLQEATRVIDRKGDRYAAVFVAVLGKEGVGILCYACNKVICRDMKTMKTVSTKTIFNCDRHTNKTIMHNENVANFLTEDQKRALKEEYHENEKMFEILIQKKILSEQELRAKRKEQRIQFLKEVHTVVTGEWSAFKLVNLQAHDENLKPDSTTKGSLLDGNTPAIAIQALSNMTEDAIKAEVREAESIGLMLDESQDYSKSEMMAFIAKLVDSLGHTKIRLLKMKHLKDLSADGLFKAFNEVIEEYQITKKQLEALNTDGASVVASEINGLHGKVKAIYKKLVWIHCAAHRLALAVKHALEGTKTKEGVKGYSKLESRFNAVRKFIHDSSKSWHNLVAIAKEFNDASTNISKVHKVRWLSVHNALNSFLGKYYSVLVELNQIQASPDDETRKHRAVGHFRYFANVLVIAKYCVLADLTEGTNGVSKLMQTREVESHEILAEIEALENALDEVKIAENTTKISGLWRTETLFEKRMKLEDENVFLMPDDDNKSGSLAKQPEKKAENKAEIELNDKNSESESENEDDEKFEPLIPKELARSKDGNGIRLKKRGKVKKFDDWKNSPDYKALGKFAHQARDLIKDELKFRFPEDSRKAMKLSAVFDYRVELPKAERSQYVNFIINRYKDEVTQNHIMIRNDFKSLEFFQKQIRDRWYKNKAKRDAQEAKMTKKHRKNAKKLEKKFFQDALERKLRRVPRFAATALKIRTKVKAISEVNAEPERFFSLMNRLKDLLKNRLLPENTDRRMRIWTHAPKNKDEVDWEKLYKIFQNVKSKKRGFYNVNYDRATNAFREFLEPTELTVSLL